MFNLTVDEAHTFYVGENGWLVHNGSGTLNTALGGVVEDNMQAHHLIPQEYRNNRVIKLAIQGGFKFDGARNGILLPDNLSLSNSLELPTHSGSHPSWNTYVQQKLNILAAQNPSMTPDEARRAVENLTRNLTDDVVKMGGGVKIGC